MMLAMTVLEQDYCLPLSNCFVDSSSLATQIYEYLDVIYPDAVISHADGTIRFVIDDKQYQIVLQIFPQEVPATLSPRELEVVELVAAGHPNKTIAHVLGISPCTVSTYISRVFDKLNVGTRSEMTAYAVKYGLIQLYSQKNHSLKKTV
jgi:DNA-binding NarL/FixJ family response regulator